MLSVLQELLGQGIAVRSMQPPLAESMAGPFIRRNWVGWAPSIAHCGLNHCRLQAHLRPRLLATKIDVKRTSASDSPNCF
jgi:hypothetical protein